MVYYQAGDIESFDILYTRHSGRVFGYLRKKVPSEVAQELLQDVFVKLHKSRGSYKSELPFLPWLFTVTRNVIFDHYRKSETKLIRQTAPLEDTTLLSESVQLNSVDLLREAQAILAELPQRQQEVLQHRYLDGWSFEKIAATMALSPANVRKIASRSLKTLIANVANKRGSK